MKIGFFLSLFLLLPFFSFSQSLHIVYDAQSGNLSYFEDGIEINSPMVKKGQKITLKVVNYNNYLYQLNIKEVHEEKRLSSNTDLLVGLKGIGFNQFADIIPNIYQDMDSDGVVDFFDEDLPSIDFESKEEQLIYELQTKASAKLEAINSIKFAFEEMDATIEEYQSEEKFKAIALQEVNKLKYNPSIATKKIKNTSESILKQVLNITYEDNPSLPEVIENNKQGKKLKELLKNQERIQNNYSSEVNTLKLLQSELVSRAQNRVDLLELFFDMEERILEAPKVEAKSQITTTAINNLITKEENRDLSKLMDIWYEYEAISSNDFSTTYISTGESDQVVFDVAFELKESVPEGSTAQKLIQLAPIKVPVYGGLKINASVGINFGQYFNRPKSYFVRDSVILGQVGDSFIPMITSFVHVYPQGRGLVALGGSLGIGIPISGEGLESTSFFIGPSLFFGQSERFVLNTGLMGGKVKRLAVGYKEGDFYSGGDNFIPTEGLYELGFFIGLSFNIRG